jgi:hypothetical protein
MTLKEVDGVMEVMKCGRQVTGEQRGIHKIMYMCVNSRNMWQR